MPDNAKEVQIRQKCKNCKGAGYEMADQPLQEDPVQIQCQSFCKDGYTYHWIDMDTLSLLLGL